MLVLKVAAIVKGLPVEDRLDEASKYNSWKPRVLMAMEEHDILNFVEEDVPESEDNSRKYEWKKIGVKERNIMMDSVRDHLVPHISKLKTTKEMFNALKRLFENTSTIRDLALRHQL